MTSHLQSPSGPQVQAHTPMNAARALDAVADLLYLVDELSADGFINYDEECDFLESEQFCGRECESCGCIKAKVEHARAAIARATT
jgi:hypothetical protein